MSVKKKNNALFWKIKLAGSDVHSYLFGTMHLIPKIHFSLPLQVEKSLKECRTLYLEMNISGDKEKALISSNAFPQLRISDHLSEIEVAELSEILSNRFGMSLEDVDHLHPMVIINLLIHQPFGEQEVISVEANLIDLAIESGIKIKGLETAKAQMKMGNLVFTARELLRQLKQPLDSEQVMEDTIRAYLLQDIDMLESAAKDPKIMSEQAQKILLTQRNKKWEKKIPKLLEKQEPLFFAVGAGHLGGKSGLIRLLEEKGLQVSPINLKWKQLD